MQSVREQRTSVQEANAPLYTQGSSVVIISLLFMSLSDGAKVQVRNRAQLTSLTSPVEGIRSDARRHRRCFILIYLHIFCYSAVLFSHEVPFPPVRINVVFCNLIESVLVREVVLPGFQVVDKLVFSAKPASLDAARAATKMAEIMRRVVVNSPHVPIKVTNADVTLFAARPVTDINALNCSRTECIAWDFTCCLGLWWF
jgi:hypothetical protein